jgi:general secretion pathway protein G
MELKMYKRGFTILEVIFVIAVIGIITAIALPRLGSLGSDAKVNVVKQDISSLKSGIQSYYIVHQKIEKISDVISLNPTIWTISDKKVVFKDNDKDCAEIEIVTENLKTKLQFKLNNSVSNNCQKLYDSGVRSEDFMLN